MKILYSESKIWCLALIMFSINLNAQNVNVTSTGGTPTASYGSLNLTIAAINNGTHTGQIYITIINNLTETTIPTPLQASGVSSASYSYINIKPIGDRVITNAINYGANRGLIELWGADNVCIDGDDPATSGTRNLTLNLGINSFNQTCCIKIASVSATNACTNDTIRNCILKAGRPSNTFVAPVCAGILIGSNSTVTPYTTGGTSNNSIVIENNEILKAFYGIFSLGTTANPFSFIQIIKNVIGKNAIAQEEIGRAGIFMAHSSTAGAGRALIESNEILAGVNTSSAITFDASGIVLQEGNPEVFIHKNYIHDIACNNTSTSNGAFGIEINPSFVTTIPNINITNNIIRDVIGAKKTTVYGTVKSNTGIYANGATGLKVIHNSIGLIAPNVFGATTNSYNSAVYITNTSTLSQFINNIIVNKNISTNAYCINIGDNATAFNAPTLAGAIFNKNCYYYPSASMANTIAPTNLGNWSLISSFDNSSFVENPPFISTTNLHITPGIATKLESNALFTPLSIDIDNDSRPGPSGAIYGGGIGKDIGADEFDGKVDTPPMILIVGSPASSQPCSPPSFSNGITAILDPGNSLDSVKLEYSFNNGVKTVLKMTKVNNTTYNVTIPAAIPANAVVAYRVFCTTKTGDTISANYNYYSARPVSLALLPTLTSTPPQACIGSTVSLKYSYPPDPTGFIFPPSVMNPTLFADISNVSFKNIINTTAINSLAGTAPFGTAIGTVGAYSDFSSFYTDSFVFGRSYPVSFSSVTNGNAKNYISAFIDFNGDGDFSDLNENVYNSVNVLVSGARTETGNIFIHPSAKPGKTRMRIIISTSQVMNAYTNIVNGEVEDYSIYIKPYDASFMIGVTPIGTSNPLTYTVTTLPTNFYVDLKDSTPCTFSSNPPFTITASAGTISALTKFAPVNACFNTDILMTVVPVGGCPPFTYNWSTGQPNTASNTSIATMSNVTYKVTITVIDKNGSSKTDSFIIPVVNPKPLKASNKKDGFGNIIVDTATPYVCNRGTALLRDSSLVTDSLYWYNNISTPPFSYNGIGKTYTTPSIATSQNYYVSAFRASADSAGKLNTTGTFASVISTNVGLKFTANQTFILDKCAMYIAGPTTAKINVGLLDKYGTILAQTGDITPTFAASIVNPTIITLNFNVSTVDTGYRLVLLNQIGLTTMNRNTGVAYPITVGASPLVVTGSYSISGLGSEYWYFYNIKIKKAPCVGEKYAIHAKVSAPTVPKIAKDLVYTQICKGTKLNLKLVLGTYYKDSLGNILKTIAGLDSLKKDTFGNKFVWTKNNIVQQDTQLPSTLLIDTSTKDSLVRNISTYADTGLYQVRIYSSKLCTRDTFSREVRVAFYPEVNYLKNLDSLDVCINSTAKLSVNTDVGVKFKWKKNGALPYLTTDTTKGELNFSNISYADTGIYEVITTDINNCRDVASNQKRLIVHDTPSVTLNPKDEIICDGNKHTIKAEFNNALTYQWYKDGGIMTGFNEDNIILYSAILADSGYYRLEAKSYPGCPVGNTDLGHLIVNPSPKILGIYPPEVKYCEGTKILLNSTTKDALNVQWFKLPSTTPISTSDSLVIPSAFLTTAGTYYFRANPLNTCKFTQSKNIILTGYAKSTIQSTISNKTVCSGTELNLGFNVLNGKQYQWFKNDVVIQDFTDSLFNPRFISKRDTGTYYMMVSSDSICPFQKSNSFKIIVQEAPAITSKPIGDTVCQGMTVPLFVVADNAIGFQWTKSGVPLGGGTSNSYDVTNINSSKVGYYRVEVKGQAPCTSVFSDSAHADMRSGETNAYVSKVSIFNAIEQCTDINDWTYYSPDDDESKYIFAVKKNGNNIVGRADVVLRTNTFLSHNVDRDSSTALIMLKRFWNYKIVTGDLTGPVDVKFYLSDSEIAEFNAMKTNFLNNYPEYTTSNGGENWFRSDGVPFTNLLLNQISGSKIGFAHKFFNTFDDGAEINGVKFVRLFDVKTLGGGSLIYTLKGPGFLNSSVLESDDKIKMNVYPNPSNGEFSINLITAKSEMLKMVIYNSLGQQVYIDELNLKSKEFTKSFNISQLAKGMYTILIQGEDIIRTQKLQIEK